MEKEQINKMNKIYNLIILDESGSMQQIKDITISGFNEQIQTIKATEEKYPNQKNFITLVSFNTMGIKTHYHNLSVSELKEIDREAYRPNAGTPLFDAVGFACTRLKHEIEEEKDVHVITTILTDGLENASREYNNNMIRNMIEELKADNWIFNYIGTEHDVEDIAQKMSISNTLAFQKTESGTTTMFDEQKAARMVFSQKLEMNADNLDDYFITKKKSQSKRKKKE